MTSQDHDINRLLQKLEELAKQQEQFSEEIRNLQFEINALRNPKPKSESLESISEIPRPEAQLSEPEPFSTSQKPSTPRPPRRKTISTGKTGWEKFIGENLINKIGIAITIIGVSFGAKYAIENDLINPLTRIILAYIFSVGMLITGMRLKLKYENFSAVLVSGAAALLYIITYIAYDFYSFIPQLVAFALMVVFTAFTVFAAIQYNRQIIAHIGLVGAYAVPFLLSDGSGNFFILLSYMAIINVGILVIAFKKDWKPLFFSAFCISWLIFTSWKIFQYYEEADFWPTLIFLTIFFFTFYITFFAYRFKHNSSLKWTDVALLIANSFIFYGLAYSVLNSNPIGEQLLGIFTIGNAILHAGAGFVLHRKKLIGLDLRQLIAAMVLTFVTIAIPVQLDGAWITLFWAAEAALIFWIGRRRQIMIYEKLAYPLIALGFIALFIHWSMVYTSVNQSFKPFLNVHLLTSIIVTAAYGVINYFFFSKKYPTTLSKTGAYYAFLTIAIPTIFIITAYYGFKLEIECFWDMKYQASAISIPHPEYNYQDQIYNHDLLKFKTIWIINYSLVFMALLSLINILKIKHRIFGLVTLALNIFALLSFLTIGLLVFSELRDSFFETSTQAYFQKSGFYLGLRYISYLLVGILLCTMYLNVQWELIKLKLKPAFDLFVHLTLLWILSSELINLMEISQSEQSYKLGLSILWGAYSLVMIVFGIWKKNQLLRMGAMALFGITLIKLFFYDIAHLNALSKTIVFIALGIFLLVISFLYNKYKHLIEHHEA